MHFSTPAIGFHIKASDGSSSVTVAKNHCRLAYLPMLGSVGPSPNQDELDWSSRVRFG